MRRLTVAIMIAIFMTISVFGCSTEVKVAVPFSIEVNPQLVTHAYAGQAYTFSVTVSSEETRKKIKTNKG